MSIQQLTNSFRGLACSTSQAKALSASRNGICSCQRVLHTKPQQAASTVSFEIVCGKVKTRKAVSKRFKVTGSGKVVRRRPSKQHMNEKMSRSKIRKLSKQVVVADRDLPNITPNLPYTGVRQSRN